MGSALPMGETDMAKMTKAEFEKRLATLEAFNLELLEGSAMLKQEIKDHEEKVEEVEHLTSLLVSARDALLSKMSIDEQWCTLPPFMQKIDAVLTEWDKEEAEHMTKFYRIDLTS
jgi:hypothetical protein